MKLKDSIIIILLFIVAVALGIFAGIKITENNQQNNNDNNQQNNNENKVTVESAKTKYVNFVNEYKRTMVDAEVDADAMYLPMPDDIRHINKVSLKENGVATIYFEETSSYYKEYSNGKILDGKYIMLDALYYGNGGLYGYILIKEDGTVTFINEFAGDNVSSAREHKLEITENYKSYQNIVSVFDCYHSSTSNEDEYNEKDKDLDGWIFTDIEGNTY